MKQRLELNAYYFAYILNKKKYFLYCIYILTLPIFIDILRNMEGEDMLCQFTFKNFKSYRDETTFDLQAASVKDGKENAESLLRHGENNKEFLPVSVLYGPNAERGREIGRAGGAEFSGFASNQTH